MPSATFSAEPPLPDEPTQAPPGSPEKVEEMRRRVANGRALRHPLDSAGPAWGGRARGQPPSPPKVKVYRLATG
jgi:hypothetical protein